MALKTGERSKALRVALHAFTAIQQQLALPKITIDVGTIEAVSQLVVQTSKRIRGVLPPFRRSEYSVGFSPSAVSVDGLRAYVSVAISALTVEIEKDQLLSTEVLLPEIEDLIRNTPPPLSIHQHTEAAFGWLGRAAAVIEKWNPEKRSALEKCLYDVHLPALQEGTRAYRGLITLLHQARNQIRLETVGPANVVIGQKMVFDYFDELRKLIEPARKDLFFVDPYLDAEFVSRYLPHVAQGVTIRLLADKKISTLLPAVDALTHQTVMTIAVRAGTGFHDRYVFVDKSACYQSGASFKDGAKSAPTTLTQITDAFPAILKTYEDLWSQSRIVR